MTLTSLLKEAKDGRQGCQCILDWLVRAQARDEYATHAIVGWLAGVQSREEMTTLPRGRGVAIVRQIRVVEAHDPALFSRQRDVTRALDTLMHLLERHAPGQTILRLNGK